MTDHKVFVCSDCGAEYPYDETDGAQEMQEALENWGIDMDTDMAVICDKCYHTLMEKRRLIMTMKPWLN